MQTKASVVLFTGPSARAGYDTRSKGLCGTIYPTPPLGQDMTQGPKASVVLFTQPLRSGRIWHKVQRPLWYYLPNPSARAGYDTRSKGLCGTIYPTPPLGQDMTQGPKASVVLFTQPLRSGRIWHKVQRPLWYYLPNPSARAGYDTRSKGLCGILMKT